ncbi:mitochondrial carrier domain-containing protein [Scheffersomyces amazonensis]|uniref:mitochondrial carrier domain-containing protein n=1 Tax=Scheffersomyces amazonensis TaxID=1078765 RepID=UPI00315C5DD8
MSQVFTASAIPLSFDPTHESLHQHESKVPPQPPKNDNNHDKDVLSPVFNCMLAGGFGGMVGDTSMHSLDTVKTRQQGLIHHLKYKNMIPAYITIFKEEGFFRGLYGGYSPAILGSFPSTAAFFGTYEYSKRKLINDYKLNETFSYFIAGILGDFASSIFYVPSEVLKTRLQLQGRYNNPYTKGSGYNYKGLINAIVSISKVEGNQAFFFGYKETLFRDLPFSALQFAFYERFRQLAIIYNKGSSDLPVSMELATGAAAGGLAGTLTTPLDVIKTRIQTATTESSTIDTTKTKTTTKTKVPSKLPLASTFRALSSIYKNEGILGAFSGVGPRFIWTGVQSSIMLLLYQMSLKQLDSILDSNEKRTFAS